MTRSQNASGQQETNSLGCDAVRILQLCLFVTFVAYMPAIGFVFLEKFSANPVKESAAKISASSHLGSYGPEGLFEFEQPGWHSERAPKYPQSIHVVFRSQRDVQALGFLPQDGYSARSPKRVRIRVSSDGESWVTAATAEDVCLANAQGGWHFVKLSVQVKVRFVIIDILENCGDPSLLTLRGLRIE